MWEFRIYDDRYDYYNPADEGYWDEWCIVEICWYGTYFPTTTPTKYPTAETLEPSTTPSQSPSLSPSTTPTRSPLGINETHGPTIEPYVYENYFFF